MLEEPSVSVAHGAKDRNRSRKEWRNGVLRVKRLSYVCAVNGISIGKGAEREGCAKRRCNEEAISPVILTPKKSRACQMRSNSICPLAKGHTAHPGPVRHRTTLQSACAPMICLVPDGVCVVSWGPHDVCVCVRWTLRGACAAGGRLRACAGRDRAEDGAVAVGCEMLDLFPMPDCEVVGVGVERMVEDECWCWWKELETEID